VARLPHRLIVRRTTWIRSVDTDRELVSITAPRSRALTARDLRLDFMPTSAKRREFTSLLALSRVCRFCGFVTYRRD
jgi:hypothetical protein